MRFFKRGLALVFALMLGIGLLHMTASAAAYATYTINGVSVRCDDFKSRPHECWAYANNVYNKIWGVRFNSNFDDDHNSLRNLSDEELTLTPEHLKAYVSNAPLGACLRICNSKWLHSSDGWGHSQIIVQKDADGFTVIQGGLSSSPYRNEHYYTWEEYVKTQWLGGTYDYIKYVKWPDAPEYSPNYTISYDSNGGTGAMSDHVLRVGEVLSLSPNAFAFDGHIFDGWNVKRSDNAWYMRGMGWMPEEEVISGNHTKSTYEDGWSGNFSNRWTDGVAGYSFTFYAQWKPVGPGDINRDGELNNKDATRLFQHLSKWNVVVEACTLDVNGDGEVNNKDATRLFQYLSGWDVEIFISKP